MPGLAMVEFYTIADRSIVRCSVTQQILAIFRQPWLFFGYFLCVKGKESNKQAIGKKDMRLKCFVSQPATYCVIPNNLEGPLINVANDKKMRNIRNPSWYLVSLSLSGYSTTEPQWQGETRCFSVSQVSPWFKYQLATKALRQKGTRRFQSLPMTNNLSLQIILRPLN